MESREVGIGGWETWRERERQSLLLVLSLANQCSMQNTGED